MFSGTYNRNAYHGGDLIGAGQRYGTHAPSWIDLSTGINPIPYPLPKISPDAWQRLPSSELETELLKSARNYYNIANAADLIAASGTQSLIQMLPYLVAPTEVAIVTPTYAEHEICWQRAGHQIIECRSLASVPDRCNVVIVVSPNNPTGAIYNTDDLKILSQKLRAKGGLLVIDEAFMDVSPDQSICPALPSAGIITLKSFGKFFGLAGVRLGFAAGDHDVITQLRARLGPWAVSGIAMEVANTAFKDNHWILEARNRLAADRKRLETMLSDAGLTVLGGTDLFSYAQSEKAAQIHEHLCQQHILIRPFATDPSKLRFGHPACTNDWDRLSGALRI